MYELGKKVLFRMDAESAHALTMRALHAAPTPVLNRLKRAYSVESVQLHVRAFGIDFPNPVGLAAGFDKNAEHIEQLFVFGFGHIEIGTVTGQAQPGNPKPRLFRIPKDRALLNRMGFNNAGCESVALKLRQRRPPGILGINIGKTKVVPNERASEDYAKSLRTLFEFADYFVINVSSPNTPGLRELQGREPLTKLLNRLQELNIEIAQGQGSSVRPILLKIAPDLTDDAIQDVVEVVHGADIAGIVATNTTISRKGLSTDVEQLGDGGISGAPIAHRSREVIRKLRSLTRLPIIGVGGIFTADDALKTLHSGANLVQVWSGFVYQGPAMVRAINEGLIRQGFGSE